MKAKKLVIAIDGPAASGKGTVAKELAGLLGYQWIDSGAMYRVLARKAIDCGISLDDEEKLCQIALDLNCHFKIVNGMNHIVCNGRDYSSIIRDVQCDMGSSKVSTHPKVREMMVKMQQNLGKFGGVVMEGRDIGTVVFPEADVKIFLTASLEERAKRRVQQYRELHGKELAFAEVLAEMQARDAQDVGREASPLKKAEDAVVIDTDGVSIENVVDTAMDLVRVAQGGK